jgi:hypothetical protein
MVVYFLGKKGSKVDIVMQVRSIHKLGYGLQPEVAPQVGFVLTPKFRFPPRLRLTSNRNMVTRSDRNTGASKRIGATRTKMMRSS